MNLSSLRTAADLQTILGEITRRDQGRATRHGAANGGIAQNHAFFDLFSRVCLNLGALGSEGMLVR